MSALSSQSGSLPKPYYEDDAVTIYHADARQIAPLLAFDLIVTDPPYGIAWKRSENKARGSKAHLGIANDEDTTVRDDVLALFPDVPAAVFGSFYAPFPTPLKQVLVWPKPADAGLVGSTTGFRRDAEPVFLVGPWPVIPCAWTSILPTGARGMAATVTATGHPHTKPLGLMRDLLSKCPPGVVLDPFMGSGSTVKAAKDIGRRAIGIELEERYCHMAAARLSQEVFDMGEAA